MNHIHVFPVDPSLTPDEAWDELRLMGVRTTYTGPDDEGHNESWATLECDGIECSSIHEDACTPTLPWRPPVDAT